MRILQVITRADSGGAQSIVLSLSESLCEAGHRVAIVSGPGGQGEAWRGIDSRVTCLEVKHLVRPVSPINDFLAVRELSKIYRDWKPDVVHLHTSKAGAIGRLASGVESRRIVYTMHGYDQLRVANRKLLFIDKALKKHCGTVVAVSKADLDAMIRDGYEAELVRNGTKDARGLSLENEEALVQITRLRGKYPSLAVLVARDAPPKRIDLAREAAARLKGSAGIVWFGGSPRADDPPDFHALGSVRNAGAYIGLCDIFLLLSNHEGLSVSMLEAFSSGLPTIASAIPGCLEALELDTEGIGKRGIAVSNNAEMIAAAIAKLTVDKELRLSMGREARKAWEELYSNGKMTEGYVRIYNRLMIDSRTMPVEYCRPWHEEGEDS